MELSTPADMFIGREDRGALAELTRKCLVLKFDIDHGVNVDVRTVGHLIQHDRRCGL